MAPEGASCPYHYEYVEDCLFTVAGEVTVRTPEGERLLTPGALDAPRRPRRRRPHLPTRRRRVVVSAGPRTVSLSSPAPGVGPGRPGEDQGVVWERLGAVVGVVV